MECCGDEVSSSRWEHGSLRCRTLAIHESMRQHRQQHVTFLHGSLWQITGALHRVLSLMAQAAGVEAAPGGSGAIVVCCVVHQAVEILRNMYMPLPTYMAYITYRKWNMARRLVSVVWNM